MELLAKRLYTGTNWLEHVRLHVNSRGLIESLEHDVKGPFKDNHVIVPGIPNLHSHAFQRAFAGFSELKIAGRDSFWSWRKVMYDFLAHLTPDDAHDIARWLYIEMLKMGYTRVGEFHYLHHNQDGSAYEDTAEMSHQVIGAALETGIGITHLPVLYAYSGFNNAPPLDGQKRFLHGLDAYASLIQKLHENYGDQSQVTIGIAPHSLRAASVDMIGEAIAALDQHNPQAPIHIHIAEQIKEVEDCLSATGKRPVQLLLDGLDVNQRWCLVHATHMTEQETLDLARSGAVAGICPTTEANLGDGLFPAPQYLQAGGVMGIGSDSHISVNPIEELRILEYGQRLVRRERAVLCDAQEAHVGQNLFSRSLKGGAQAMGVSSGELAVGKPADLLVLDGDAPCLWGKDQGYLLDGWVFAGNDNPIRAVMVGGKWAIREGHHEQQDIAYERFKRVQQRVGS